jgi:fucose 4-O-acetylase-like acetyltransferase
MKGNVEQTRDDFMDVFKAFGIIFMVMGHIGFGDLFDGFIHAFHMPMFFVVSGYYYKDIRGGVYFAKKKAKSLLIPYVVFAVFYSIVNIFFGKYRVMLHFLWDNNTDGVPFLGGALWFFTALFISETIYYGIRKFVDEKIQIVVIIFISMIGCLVTGFLSFRFPWSMDAGFVGVGLMHMGYWIRKLYLKGVDLTNLNFIVVSILMVMAVLGIFNNGYINMRNGTYAIIPLFWINVFITVIVGINLSKMLKKIIPSVIYKFIAYIGENSVVYLCLNQFVIVGLNYYFKFISMSGLRLKMTELTITVIILFISSIVINNTKLRLLFGKGYN